MNIANNKDFKKSPIKVCAISQNFLPQGKIYNLLTKSYYCVLENTIVNAVNAAKTTLWQSNVSNLLNKKEKKTYVGKTGATLFGEILVFALVANK